MVDQWMDICTVCRDEYKTVKIDTCMYIRLVKLHECIRVHMYVCMYVYENNHFFSSQVSVLLESLREQEQSLQYMLVFFDEISALKSHQGQGRTA